MDDGSDPVAEAMRLRQEARELRAELREVARALVAQRIRARQLREANGRDRAGTRLCGTL
jgi:hypothetical protein